MHTERKLIRMASREGMRRSMLPSEGTRMWPRLLWLPCMLTEGMCLRLTVGESTDCSGVVQGRERTWMGSVSGGALCLITRTPCRETPRQGRRICVSYRL